MSCLPPNDSDSSMKIYWAIFAIFLICTIGLWAAVVYAASNNFYGFIDHMIQEKSQWDCNEFKI